MHQLKFERFMTFKFRIKRLLDNSYKSGNGFYLCTLSEILNIKFNLTLANQYTICF